MEVLITVLLGLGTVFVGLICIILLVMLLKFASGNAGAQAPAAAPVAAPAAPVAAPAAPAAAAPAEIPNRQEFVAAVSAVLAEELGTDVSAIRIHSIKKI